MWSQQIRGKFVGLALVPFCGPIGLGHFFGGLLCVNGAICRFSDGRSVGDALEVPFCLLFVASGLFVLSLMLRPIREPYELRLDDQGPLDVICLLCRTRIWPHKINSMRVSTRVSTRRIAIVQPDPDFIRLYCSHGHVDVPRPERLDELISLLTSRNPDIRVE